MSAQTLPTETTALPAVPRHAWQALAVLLLGVFIALIDTTIVNVALPSIRNDLNASEATLAWIISGYALAFGLALIPAGRVGDRIGHKWVFFTGMVLFTIASLACALAQNDVQLIVARVVQGLAGGIFVPAVTAYIQLLFPGHARGKAFAIQGAVLGISAALGPIIGGLLIETFGTENGWRFVFFVNLPIGILAAVLATILLPKRDASVPRSTLGLDWTGVLLISASFIAILVPLIQGQDAGWPAWTFISIISGIALLAAFGVWEVAYTKRGKSPLVPPNLFHHPAFTTGVILALVYFAAFTSIFFTISILWQAGLGFSALASGFVAVPFALGSMVSASQSNRLSVKLGRNVLIMGTALVALGLGWLWLVLLTTVPTELDFTLVLLPLLIAGIGNGLFIAPNVQFIVATVEQANAGAASAVIAAVQQIGSAIGIAIIGTVFFGSLVITAPTPDGLATGFTTAAASAMLVSAIFAVAAFALVFTLPRKVNTWSEHAHG
jgi:EmrB/QacA subfamily drug resistance transporter